MMSAFPPMSTLIPHAESMRLVDEVVSIDQAGNGAVRAYLRESAPYFISGRFNPIWTVEIMAQSVASIAQLHQTDQSRPRVGYLISIDRWESTDPVASLAARPGDIATIDVTMEVDLHPVGVYATTMRVNETPIAAATMKFIIDSRETPLS